jgi:hypothetical protein
MQRHIGWVKNLFCYEIFMILWREFLFKCETYYKAVYAVIVWENCGTVIVICEAGHFLSRNVITGYRCICIKCNTVLGLVDTESDCN